MMRVLLYQQLTHLYVAALALHLASQTESALVCRPPSPLQRGFCRWDGLAF